MQIDLKKQTNKDIVHLNPNWKSEAIAIWPNLRDHAIAKQHKVVRLFFKRIHSSALCQKVPPSLVCEYVVVDHVKCISEIYRHRNLVTVCVDVGAIQGLNKNCLSAAEWTGKHQNRAERVTVERADLWCCLKIGGAIFLCVCCLHHSF